MRVLRLCSNRFCRSALALLAVGLCFGVAPGIASACTASAFLSGRDSVFQDWRGNAVGCNRSWTYSWRIRWYHNGNVLEEHINQGLGGATSYSTPTYHNTEFYSSSSNYTVTFFIYHSSTVGNNLVDKATASLN